MLARKEKEENQLDELKSKLADAESKRELL